MQLRASAVAGQVSNVDSHHAIDHGPQPVSPPPSSSSSLPCPECGQNFRRREHLNRHLDRHSGRRSYTCSVCKASFSRRDTLKRHVGTHGNAALAAWTENNSSLSRHQQCRACEPCARAKQRCDGLRPASCTNCTNKGRRCSYQPYPGDGGTVLNAQPRDGANDDAASAVPSSPSQHFEPLTPLSCDPVQPWLEPDLTWETLLTSAQFLFPFSPVPSLQAGSSTHFSFEDPSLASADQAADDQRWQNSFSAEATEGEPVEAVQVFVGPENLTAEEEDILIAENIPHVSPMTAETRAYMIEAIRAGLPENKAQELHASFPSLRHLDTYMQLYFEHFHPRTPLLHVPTFQASPKTWQLVLSIVCLGSRYSLAHQHQEHVLLLQRLAKYMLKRDIRELSSVNVLTFAQSHLLFQQSLWLAGEWGTIVEVQFYRNILLTLCRLLLSREATLMHTHTPTEDVNHAWFQWIQAEAKRRIVHFAYTFDCLCATFLMTPPLLSTAELQIPVPSADSYWSSSCEEWHLLPPPQTSSTLCALLARVGLGDVAPGALEPLTKSAILFSALIHQAVESDFLRAMGLDSTDPTGSQLNPALGTVATLSQKAFDALSQLGCSQALRERDASIIISDDFPLLSRVLYILSFTPLSLIFSCNKWQTTDMGQSEARSRVLNIIPQNVSRARHCLYYAAQVFQYFRTTTKPATVLDILSVLVCGLYMVLYVDTIERQDPSFGDSSVGTSSKEILRLDQVVDQDVLDDWLQVKRHKRLHVPGVGLLHNIGSIPRLYKEASRVMATGSSISGLAKEISSLLEAQAKGYPPTYKAERVL